MITAQDAWLNTARYYYPDQYVTTKEIDDILHKIGRTIEENSKTGDTNITLDRHDFGFSLEENSKIVDCIIQRLQDLGYKTTSILNQTTKQISLLVDWN